MESGHSFLLSSYIDVDLCCFQVVPLWEAQAPKKKTRTKCVDHFPYLHEVANSDWWERHWCLVNSLGWVQCDGKRFQQWVSPHKVKNAFLFLFWKWATNTYLLLTGQRKRLAWRLADLSSGPESQPASYVALSKAMCFSGLQFLYT